MEIRHAPARLLEPYLEHDGTINDDELGAGEGGYLAALAGSGACLDEDEPLELAVWEEPDGPRASVRDGNHRLIIALEDEPGALVPYRISHEPGSHPGFSYDGALGR